MSMKLLTTNEGMVDRILRIALGMGLLALTVVGPRSPWGYVGIVPLLTGLIGSCPLYTILGVNTCPAKTP